MTDCNVCRDLLAAAVNGHLKCLKYLHEEQGYEWNQETCAGAACAGQLNCLKYIFEDSKNDENGCPWDESTCYYAVSNGHLNCVKYACENGCPISYRVCLTIPIKYDCNTMFIYLIGLNARWV